ncbi:MAG: LamG-like jellyroll fold domain-containing protein [Mucilaginibacter sp.]|uniref:LamG-like jellyroll fold domain-containing protein n=1 Tax=Mucilaginibacter sp. TaxID=1882438 RepID=UPI0031A295FE
MKKSLLLLCAVIALFTACKKTDTPPADPLKGILFTDTLRMYDDDVVQLHYTTTPSNYDPSLLVWTASDTTVLTVSGIGKVTAKNEGISTVTLTNKAKTFFLSGIIAVKSKLDLGLLAYYPFNNSTADISGNKNNGLAYNLTSGADRFGKANSAYYFNGSGSYIRVKDNMALRLNNTDFTLNTWTKLDNYGSTFGVNLLSKHLSGADNGWAWGITGFQIYPIGIVTYGPGGGSAFSRGVLTVGLNQWHMVTTVYSVQNQSISIYVDGVFDNITYGQPSPKGIINSDLYIGRDNPEVPTDGYFVKGLLDDIRIYNRALSAADIKKLYNLTH